MKKFVQSVKSWLAKLKLKLIEDLLQSYLWEWFSINVSSGFDFRVWKYPKFDLEVYESMKKIVKDNPKKMYAIVGADTLSMTFFLNHVFTGCMYGHAGIARLDDDGNLRFIHVIGDGLSNWYLPNYLRETDRAALIEIPMSEENALIAKRRLAQLEAFPHKIKYNFGMKWSDEFTKQLDSPEWGFKEIKIYCSQLVYIVCNGLVNDKDFKPQFEQGKLAFQPDDVFNGGNPVIEFDGTKPSK